MYSQYRAVNASYESPAPVMDDPERLELILDALCSVELAEWIAEATRLAVDEHLRQEALENQSALEAENSKK